MTVNELINQFARYVSRFNDVDISQMAGLAEGTNSATLKTTTAIIYNVYNSVGLTKAATDNIAMTACAQQIASTFCYYLCSLNSSGTVTVTKGTNNTYALPATPAGNTPFGAFLVTTDASHTFTSGTTDLSATGITAAFYDIDTGIALSLINQAQRRLERGVVIVNNNRQIFVTDFDHMKVRADVALVSGDTTVTIPFSNFKEFADNGLTLQDASGITTQLTKDDNIPLGYSLQQRPTKISRRPVTETTFTSDIAPTVGFKIWPMCDQSYTLNVIAYQYSPDLDGVIYSTNWLTQNAPDILLFGALVEGAAYFQADERMSNWETRWREAVWTLYSSQQKERFNGAHISTKFRNPLTSSLYTERSIYNGY